MAIKPDILPNWATDTEDNGSNNTPNKVQPTSTKLLKGWGFPEKPPRGEFNWWMNKVGEWISHITNPAYEVQVDNYQSIAGDKIIPDNSSAPLTIVLPALPNNGDTVYFRQANNQPFSTHSLTIGRNGESIMGVASDMVISVTDNIEFNLSFNGTTWVVLKTADIGIIS